MFNGAKVSIIPQTEKGFSRKTNRKNPIKVKRQKGERVKKARNQTDAGFSYRRSE